MDILFITSNRLGDAVLSTGVLAHLLAQPGARVTVACGPVPAPLFAAMPRVHRVIPLVKQRRGGHWFALWRQVVGHPWGRVVDLRGSMMAWLVRARSRTVWRSNRSSDHRVVQLGRLMGLEEPPAPRLSLTEPARRRAAILLPESPFLALGPTANWEGKRWPAERFAELARRLTGPKGALAGAPTVIFGAASERWMVEPLLQAKLPVELIDLVGVDRGDLLVTAAALARATLFVGNDSGLMHMAAAQGVPTVGLFGPSRDDLYAPWGTRNAIVRTPESFETLRASPRFHDGTRQTMMDNLTVDPVEAAARQLLDRLSAAA